MVDGMANHQHHHHHDHAVDQDWAAMTELLDLDGEVLHQFLADATAWVRQLAGSGARIADLGSGTGTGAIALAQRFDEADVTAVDAASRRIPRNA